MWECERVASESQTFDLCTRSVEKFTSIVDETEIDLKFTTKIGWAVTVYVKDIEELQDFLSPAIQIVGGLHLNLSIVNKM